MAGVEGAAVRSIIVTPLGEQALRNVDQETLDAAARHVARRYRWIDHHRWDELGAVGITIQLGKAWLVCYSHGNEAVEAKDDGD